jgi:hypothetical protein
MSWLRAKVKNWLNGYGNKLAGMTPAPSMNIIDESTAVDIEGLRFSVMVANGGVIVQMRTYDHRKDRNLHSTYIIPDGEPVAERIGQIVSMEILKS